MDPNTQTDETENQNLNGVMENNIVEESSQKIDQEITPVPSLGPVMSNESTGIWQGSKGLFVIGISILGGCFILTLIGLSSNDYEFIEMLSGLVFWSSIAAAILFGIASAKSIMHSGSNASGGGTTSNSYTRLGIVLCILSLLTGFLTLIPGIIFLIIGSKKPPEESGKEVPKAMRITFAVIAFLAAGIGGLIVGFVMAFGLSMRACELTSSKCY